MSIDDELVGSTSRKILLEEKDKNFQAMLYHFPEGVAFYDPKQTKLYSNPYWERVGNNIHFVARSMSISSIGQFMNDKSSKPISLVERLINKDDNSTLSTVIKNLSDEHFSNHKKLGNESSEEDYDPSEANVLNHDKTEYILCTDYGLVVKEYNVKIVKIKFFNGQDSLLIIVNDVTDRLKLRDEKISGKVKTMMLCSISHELRTPLNQINGMLYLAKTK